MGTTVAGLTVVDAGGREHWVVFNIGDSRVYRLADDRMSLVTRDHSEVRELMDAGLIDADEAARHPMRNVITRSLGSDPAPSPDVWVLPPHARGAVRRLQRRAVQRARRPRDHARRPQVRRPPGRRRPAGRRGGAGRRARQRLGGRGGRRLPVPTTARRTMPTRTPRRGARSSESRSAVTAGRRRRPAAAPPDGRHLSCRCAAARASWTTTHRAWPAAYAAAVDGRARRR